MNEPTWEPPENPDPSEILSSAMSDRHVGRYADALAKYLWFFHHALEYKWGLSAVRLSFALSYWNDLAADYPPADDALRRTRDEAEAKFLATPSFEAFHDVVSLNRYLQETERSVELFLRTATERPELAERLYIITEDDLVKHKRYQECGPFLHPKQDYDQARARYRLTKKQEDSLPAGKRSPPKTATLFFYQDVTRLVALLVQNDRLEDARWVRDHALKVIDNDRFRGLLEEAMQGKFPQISPHEEF